MIKMISVPTENTIRVYACDVKDAVADYPVDCGAGSTMLIFRDSSFVGLPVAYMEFQKDGVWRTIKQKYKLTDSLDYQAPVIKGDGIALHLMFEPFKKFIVSVKESEFETVFLFLAGFLREAKCEVVLKMEADKVVNFGDIKFPVEFTPVVDHVYLLEFMTFDGGETVFGVVLADFDVSEEEVED